MPKMPTSSPPGDRDNQISKFPISPSTMASPSKHIQSNRSMDRAFVMVVGKFAEKRLRDLDRKYFKLLHCAQMEQKLFKRSLLQTSEALEKMQEEL
mmetsp:Transcript_12097/g.20405  ORF Transcript_12097/g.20405 Transcript_12097/m.20405 type:complete len:96 (+) Transcript_12097:336-623(+)